MASSEHASPSPDPIHVQTRKKQQKKQKNVKNLEDEAGALLLDGSLPDHEMLIQSIIFVLIASSVYGSEVEAESPEHQLPPVKNESAEVGNIIKLLSEGAVSWARYRDDSQLPEFIKYCADPSSELMCRRFVRNESVVPSPKSSAFLLKDGSLLLGPLIKEDFGYYISYGPKAPESAASVEGDSLESEDSEEEPFEYEDGLVVHVLDIYHVIKRK